MGKRVLIALLALVMLSSSALAELAYPGFEAGAYLGEDGKVWVKGQDQPLSQNRARSIALQDEGAVYYQTASQLIRQPLGGGAPEVMAEDVSGSACALSGVFYYLSAQNPGNIMAVQPGEEPKVVATAGDIGGRLAAGQGALYYLVPTPEGSERQYEVNLADGKLSTTLGAIYTDVRTLDSIETADHAGKLAVRLSEADGWADLDSDVQGAVEKGGALYYAQGAAQMVLKRYDPETVASETVLALPQQCSGELVAAGNYLFTSDQAGALYRIDLAVPSCEPILTDIGTGAKLAALGDELLVYSIDGAGQPTLARRVSPSAVAAPQATLAPIETPDPWEDLELEPDDEDELDQELAPTPSPTATPRPEKTAGPSGYATLVRGDRGQLVKKLQQRLIDLGYLSGKADGQYGAKTQAAVKLFQKAVGYKQTGTASIDTQKKLFSKSAPKYDAPKYVELSRGDSGEQVKKLQKRLKALGYFTANVGGNFGEETEKAVKKFQKAIDVKQTGVATVALQKKLFAKGAPEYSTDEYVKLSRGDTGERVKKLQRRLKKLGYFDGEIGGNYLELTTKAVKRFQKKIGVEATGVASVKLQERIFASDAPYYK